MLKFKGENYMNFDINPNNLSGVFSILYEYSLRNKILDEVAVREIIRIYMHEHRHVTSGPA